MRGKPFGVELGKATATAKRPIKEKRLEMSLKANESLRDFKSANGHTVKLIEIRYANTSDYRAECSCEWKSGVMSLPVIARTQFDAHVRYSGDLAVSPIASARNTLTALTTAMDVRNFLIIANLARSFDLLPSDGRPKVMIPDPESPSEIVWMASQNATPVEMRAASATISAKAEYLRRLAADLTNLATQILNREL